MYTACTRARRQLVVTAVAERVEGGLQPSRFLPEIGDVRAMPARSSTPMSAEVLVTALREAAEAPPLPVDAAGHRQVEALRAAAIRRLAALGRRGRAEGPLGPMAAADPARWWGAQPLTPGVSSRPRGDRDPDGSDRAASGPVAGPSLRLSPSAIAGLRECPLRWFLERRVGAGSPSGSAATVGLIVHAIAEALAQGEIADAGQAAQLVDEIWASMPFAAQYERVRERARVEAMLAALLRWDASTGRRVVATEARFELPVAGVTPEVVVRGSIDRVDQSPDGSLHVVDFKTGRTAASAAEAAEHPQLGVYQLAVRSGALDEREAPAGGVSPGARPPGGRRLGRAELVHLSVEYADGMPKVRSQPPLGPGRTWVDELLAEACRSAAGPDYPARVNGRCKRCTFRYVCPAQATDRGSAASKPPPTVTVGGAPAPVRAGTFERPEPLGAHPRAPAVPGAHPDGLGAGGHRPTEPPPAEPPDRPALPIQEPLWGDP